MGVNSIVHRRVPIMLITRGARGSLIIDNTQGKNEHISTRAFKVKSCVNDNGAGEAAHAAFIHTLLSFRKSPLWTSQNLRRMLEISGYIANVAGALKVQTQLSLDFRNNLDYDFALRQCPNMSIDPRTIGADVLMKYVESDHVNNYYFELNTRS